ncbi:hypothetical protein SBA5_670015 [Candidatus Sulfotelmatomonas gaucii]|uniref:Uncharacterized protein n=1 Tax=Candidatus Sulfuritelmatomonas gaucii TaxID=2043161 RepID=A0A2N9LZB5_9BACT|nr:hypothetical protein SBA5_670015 [Candidatus Sulfotelmatomonas gaucii]
MNMSFRGQMILAAENGCLSESEHISQVGSLDDAGKTEHPILDLRDSSRSKGKLKVPPSLQIGTHQVDQVLGQFWSKLFLGPEREVETNMIFQHLTHQAVDAAAHRGQLHKLITAIFVGIQRPFNCIQLAAQLAHSLKQFHFFPPMRGHGNSPVHNIQTTYKGVIAVTSS